MKTYRPYCIDQPLLLPPDLRAWLPEDHLAYFISDLIDQLDLTPILREYEDETRGYPPYHPVMIVKVLVYAYATGVYSSRQIARRLVEDIAFRVLGAGNFPDFRTIAAFRKRHLQALGELFVQVLKLCEAAGLVKLGEIVLDGSKILANASKHKAMSYERMVAKEAAQDPGSQSGPGSPVSPGYGRQGVDGQADRPVYRRGKPRDRLRRRRPSIPSRRSLPQGRPAPPPPGCRRKPRSTSRTRIPASCQGRARAGCRRATCKSPSTAPTRSSCIRP